MVRVQVTRSTLSGSPCYPVTLSLLLCRADGDDARLSDAVAGADADGEGAHLQDPAAPHHHALRLAVGLRHRLGVLAFDPLEALGQFQRQALALDGVVHVGRHREGLARLEAAAEAEGDPALVLRVAGDAMAVGEGDLA